MRRVLLVVLAVGLCLAAWAAAARGGRGQAPGEPRPWRGLDARQLDLGQLLEGDGPLAAVDLNTMPEPRRLGPVRASGPRAPTGYSVDFRHYPSSAEIDAFLSELERDYPDLVATTTLGQTWQGRRIRALRVSNERAPGEVADRPVMHLDAQHHARELISNQVALYTAWWLLEQHGRDPLATHLVDTRALYVLPSVNPDGNDIVLLDMQDMRKTANPSCCDDDFNALGTPVPDGRVDEDASVGYGYGTHNLYRYHFEPAWAAAHPDNPFVRGWQQHQERQPESLGRYTGALGGPMTPLARQDRDGDGLQNEDEIGGVDPNRNYDSHWEGGDPLSWAETFRGPALWSEPETRALRDFVISLEHAATGLSYHSGVDLILHPWGWSEEAHLPDAERFELLARKGSQLTELNGFAGSPHTWTARGLYPAAGSTMDWLYERRGLYAFSPEVYGGEFRTRVERLGATGTYTVGTAIGFGFNPVPEEILASAERWNRFATYLLAATPNLELAELRLEGELLLATVYNDGVLPAEVTVEAEAADGSWRAGPTLTLSAARGEWRFPLAALPAGGGRLRARAVSPIGTRPHEVETADWAYARDGAGLRLTAGAARPFTDLGAAFGGWWAPEAFDEPGRYHVPADRPIPVRPPATVTPAPRNTPTRTPTAPEPSASPSPSEETPTPDPTGPGPVTPTVRPPGLLLLPWLGRRTGG